MRALNLIEEFQRNSHSLPEQLATLFPGKLVVERSRGLVLVGLICRRRGGHKSALWRGFCLKLGENVPASWQRRLSTTRLNTCTHLLVNRAEDPGKTTTACQHASAQYRRVGSALAAVVRERFSKPSVMVSVPKPKLYDFLMYWDAAAAAAAALFTSQLRLFARRRVTTIFDTGVW